VDPQRTRDPAPTADPSLYRTLIDLAPDAMVGVDERGVIVLVNAQAETLFGYSRDELLGQPVEILVPDAARAAHPRHRAAYASDPRPRPMGLGLALGARRSDGSEFPAEISLAAVATDAGRLVSASIRDMTERLAAEREREQLALEAELERTERQVLQSQRLESLGQLAGGVAHDFNSLLAVIGNYAAFVREEIEAEIERTGDDRWEVVRRDVHHIEQAADNAAGLTRQLLTFARREVVHPRPLDLNDVVEETVGLLQRTLGEDVQLVVDLASDLARVVGDRGQLQQVLVNVAINARHAMPGGGTLHISTSNEGDGDHAPTVRLTVADTGCGMPPEVAARAFEPFFTTRTTEHGTGLGLATVYGIVTQAGGMAGVRSEVGVGTVFTADFPATDAAVAAPEPPRSPSATGPGTILVVDDEAGIREVAERILIRRGYDVIVASGVDEALDLARRHPGRIDLLVSDVIMPGCNGPELVTRLRAIQPDLPVVFMSGYTGTELAERSSIGERYELVEKPFSERGLVEVVASVLARSR
jgi:PAS domain S-box-containing protein